MRGSKQRSDRSALRSTTRSSYLQRDTPRQPAGQEKNVKVHSSGGPLTTALGKRVGRSTTEHENEVGEIEKKMCYLLKRKGGGAGFRQATGANDQKKKKC